MKSTLDFTAFVLRTGVVQSVVVVQSMIGSELLRYVLLSDVKCEVVVVFFFGILLVLMQNEYYQGPYMYTGYINYCIRSTSSY
jgi:hypothetical protein